MNTKTGRMPRVLGGTAFAVTVLMVLSGFTLAAIGIVTQIGRIGGLAALLLIPGLIGCGITSAVYDEMGGFKPAMSRAQRARLRHLREEIEAAEYQRTLEAENARLREMRGE